MTIDVIESIVNADPILFHPFLMKLRHGGYNREQMRIWVSQQFYFSNQFPRCLGALWCRITDYQISLPLMKFLSVEHWGSEETGAHWKQYRQVLDFFGLTINELKNTPPFIETKKYLDYRFYVCINKSIEEGLGCMAFAHELINEKIFQYYYEGMTSMSDVSDSALQYFRSHVEDEPEDYRLFKEIILSYANSDKQMKLVKQGAEKTIYMRTQFFDRIKARLDSYQLGDDVQTEDGFPAFPPIS